MTSFVHYTVEDQIAIITIDNPPMNTMCAGVRRALTDIFSGLSTDGRGIDGILLLGARRVFMAGADLTELASARLPIEPDPNRLHELIENCPVPVVAVMQGFALGGGLEMALACHWRIAETRCRLGLPEVTLGLLPGAGGTQRLPRLVPSKDALEMMIGGSQTDAGRALQIGLIDEVFDGDGIAAGRNFLVRHKDAAFRRTGQRTPPERVSTDALTSIRTKAEKAGNRAALRILDCVIAAETASLADGLAMERRQFEACLKSDEAAGLIHLFFAERDCAKVPGLDESVKPLAIERVGVIGAGTMGTGIATALADAGVIVELIDSVPTGLAKGLEAIAKTYESMVAKGRIGAAEKDRRLGLITGSQDWDRLRHCSLVIEAVFETMAVKRDVLMRLGQICSPSAVIATNTSTLDVNILAEFTGRPSQVIGLHFFSPANVMRLLEVVRGKQTAPEVLATGLSLAKAMRKVAVVSGVCYGFIGNRMLEGYLREAESLVLGGIAPQRIDSALEAFGMAMGPFRMMDMAGIDLGDKLVREAKFGGFIPDRPDYRAMTHELARLGRYGQKSGVGYYRYQDRTSSPDPQISTIAEGVATRLGIAHDVTISDDQIVERCLMPLVEEGHKILAEGIAIRSSDIDVVWTAGYGFPRSKGGPMHWASRRQGH